jgi:hypothetical protein
MNQESSRTLIPSPVARSWRLFYAMYEVLAINQRQQCNDALSHAPAFSKLSADQIRVTAPASRIHVHPLACQSVPSEPFAPLACKLGTTFQ